MRRKIANRKFPRAPSALIPESVQGRREARVLARAQAAGAFVRLA